MAYGREISYNDLPLLMYPSRPYNPDIANTMFRSGFIEAWGRGTVEIINDCLAYGMVEPEFDIILGGFKITFYAVDQGEISGLGSRKSSEITSGKILNLIRQNRNITISELSRQIGITERSVERAIQALQKEDLLKRQGGRKLGHWEILEEGDNK